jgi:hypothetical protein
LATPSDLETRDETLRDVKLAKAIGEHLEREYPGYLFRVTYESRQGIVRITLPTLLPPGYGYTVKLAQLASDPGWTLIRKAGGELLERFHLRRGRRNSDEWDDARKKYDRISRGVLKEWNFKTGESRFVLPSELAR